MNGGDMVGDLLNFEQKEIDLRFMILVPTFLSQILTVERTGNQNFGMSIVICAIILIHPLNIDLRIHISEDRLQDPTCLRLSESGSTGIHIILDILLRTITGHTNIVAGTPRVDPRTRTTGCRSIAIAGIRKTGERGRPDILLTVILRWVCHLLATAPHCLKNCCGPRTRRDRCLFIRKCLFRLSSTYQCSSLPKRNKVRFLNEELTLKQEPIMRLLVPRYICSIKPNILQLFAAL